MGSQVNQSRNTRKRKPGKPIGVMQMRKHIVLEVFW
jgi:hypothetical protein